MWFGVSRCSAVGRGCWYSFFFFFSSRRRHTRFLPVSWARRPRHSHLVDTETGVKRLNRGRQRLAQLEDVIEHASLRVGDGELERVGDGYVGFAELEGDGVLRRGQRAEVGISRETVD